MIKSTSLGKIFFFHHDGALISGQPILAAVIPKDSNRVIALRNILEIMVGLLSVGRLFQEFQHVRYP